MSINQMQNNNQISSFLKNNSGDYAAAFKFVDVGDQVVGTVSRVDIVDGKDLDGNPQQSLVIEVDTDGGETVAVWCPERKGITRAVAKAMSDAGVAMPEEGGRIVVKLAELGQPPKPGYSAPKIYTAAYKSGAQPAAALAAESADASSGVSAEDLL